MKHIKLIIATLTLTFFTSCTDWLTVQPEGKVVSSDYWKLESDVDAVVATCYRAMIETDVIEKMIVYGEMRSDNLIAGYSIEDNLKKIFEANVLPSNPYTKWSEFYEIINYCNVVIHFAPQVIDPNFTQSELNARMSEVMALRALTYFYLVRSFGEVPFITDPSIADSQDFMFSKSSENVILDYLESDLLKAEGWAMTGYGSPETNKGKITKNAIRALLADIYLWRQKYDQCITYCNKIIDDPTLKLIKADDQPFYNIFGQKNSSESIFELQFSPTNYTYNNAINNLYGTLDSYGQFIVPEFLTVNNEVFDNSKEITDVRRNDNITSKSMNNVCYVFKYPGLIQEKSINGTSNVYTYRRPQVSPANWIIYRLTDVLLMKAEALVQKNEFDKAIQMVNTTYMRSNPTLSDTLSLSNYNEKKQMEELVLLERQRELMFEGKRWFDLLRMARRDGDTKRLIKFVIRKFATNQNVLSSKMQVMDALYFPINEDELNANPNLKQNPYYESKFK